MLQYSEESGTRGGGLFKSGLYIIMKNDGDFLKVIIYLYYTRPETPQDPKV